MEFVKDTEVSDRKGRKPLIDKELTDKPTFCSICNEKHYCANHHIIPVNSGGLSNDNNMIKICKDCHDIVEPFCNTCANQIRNLCNKRKFKMCWSNDNMYFLVIDEIYVEGYQRSLIGDFKCKKCKSFLERISLWDQHVYGVGAKWFAKFRCSKCGKLHKLLMSKEIKNWTLDNENKIKINIIK